MMFDFIENFERNLCDMLHCNVVEGAEWLDTEKPGWENEIDLSTLEMSSGYACIAGQLFMGHFAQLNRAYGIAFVVAHGFEVPMIKNEMVFPQISSEIYEALAIEWIVQIEK